MSMLVLSGERVSYAPLFECYVCLTRGIIMKARWGEVWHFVTWNKASINPYAAGAVYIYGPNQVSDQINCDRSSVNEIITFFRCLFFINSYSSFRLQLRLEFVLATPALNGWKIETINSAEQGCVYMYNVSFIEQLG